MHPLPAFFSLLLKNININLFNEHCIDNRENILFVYTSQKLILSLKTATILIGSSRQLSQMKIQHTHLCVSHNTLNSNKIKTYFLGKTFRTNIELHNFWLTKIHYDTRNDQFSKNKFFASFWKGRNSIWYSISSAHIFFKENKKKKLCLHSNI